MGCGLHSPLHCGLHWSVPEEDQVMYLFAGLLDNPDVSRCKTIPIFKKKKCGQRRVKDSTTVNDVTSGQEIKTTDTDLCVQ